ncbi:MAG: SHOCT domain-containing protein [Deltaproteobacteria bacterium]|nr:SHOCT domain-containing protein [Deltaproteobacteria bacterium]
MQWTENWHMGFMWVLLAILLIGALLMLMRFLANVADRRMESPEQILRRRYAAGEIDEETYDRMVERLSRGSLGDGDEPRE